MKDENKLERKEEMKEGRKKNEGMMRIKGR